MRTEDKNRLFRFAVKRLIPIRRAQEEAVESGRPRMSSGGIRSRHGVDGQLNEAEIEDELHRDRHCGTPIPTD